MGCWIWLVTCGNGWPIGMVPRTTRPLRRRTRRGQSQGKGTRRFAVDRGAIPLRSYGRPIAAATTRHIPGSTSGSAVQRRSRRLPGEQAIPVVTVGGSRQGASMGSESICKSPAGGMAVMAAYDALLAHWPVPCEMRTIPTGQGDTYVLASGGDSAPPLVLLHGADATTGARSDHHPCPRGRPCSLGHNRPNPAVPG
jgi:hypothetical protein